MKKIILITSLFLIYTFQALPNELKLSEEISGLKSPWSISFIDESKALVTEKSGNLILVDFISKKIKKIEHNLNVLEDGQGGLLEVLYYDNQIFISYIYT